MVIDPLMNTSERSRSLVQCSPGVMRSRALLLRDLLLQVVGAFSPSPTAIYAI